MKSTVKYSLLLILTIHGCTSLFGMENAPEKEKVIYIPTIRCDPNDPVNRNTDFIWAAYKLTTAKNIKESNEAFVKFKNLLERKADPNVTSDLFGKNISAAAYLNYLEKFLKGEKLPEQGRFPDQKIIKQNKSNIEKALALLPK